MGGIPVFLPEDPAIPAPEVAATPSFTREVVPEKEILQREVKDDVPSWTWTVASGAVLALYLGFVADRLLGRRPRRPPRGRAAERWRGAGRIDSPPGDAEPGRSMSPAPRPAAGNAR